MSNTPDYTIRVRGKLVSLSQPLVMGILNATPDSFYSASRQQTEKQIADRANQIVNEGGRIIDVGAYSTRPGATPVTADEEMQRLRTALTIVRREQPDAIVSVDTFRPDVARMAVEEMGADIINDVSEGHEQGAFGYTPGQDTTEPATPEADTIPPMFQMVSRLRVPYILMSLQPTLRSMLIAFAREVSQLHGLGVSDIILDPGFGFGKTLQQNYAIMRELSKLSALRLPLLVGISRKSMIFRLLDTKPEASLNGTTVLNTLALEGGASILRVHDVREAVEAVAIHQATHQA